MMGRRKRSLGLWFQGGRGSRFEKGVQLGRKGGRGSRGISLQWKKKRGQSEPNRDGNGEDNTGLGPGAGKERRGPVGEDARILHRNSIWREVGEAQLMACGSDWVFFF